MAGQAEQEGYVIGLAAGASAFVLRIWLIPLTGTGAPFVVFFAAVLVTSLFICLTFLTKKGIRSLQHANRQVRVSEENTAPFLIRSTRVSA